MTLPVYKMLDKSCAANRMMETMEMPDTPLSPRSMPSVSSSLSSAPDSTDMAGDNKGGPKKKTRTKVIYFWSTDDVIKWMRKHCGQYHQYYAELFKRHEISGRTVVRLTDSKLQLMGITCKVHREDLMRHILRLKLKTENQELKLLGHSKSTVYEKST